MECYVHPTAPYMDQAEMFDIQGKFLRERIADISFSKVVYPGLTEDVIDNLEHPIDIPGSCACWFVCIHACTYVCVFCVYFLFHTSCFHVFPRLSLHQSLLHIWVNFSDFHV